MNPQDIPSTVVSVDPGQTVSEVTIAQLVGEVYEAAPAVERGRLLEQLLRPLGVLSVLAVANGIFAKIRFRSGWQDIRVQLDDIQHVRAVDVMALVDYVQQASVESVDGLAQLIAASPLVSTSAAAAMLVTLLVQSRSQASRRARRRWTPTCVHDLISGLGRDTLQLPRKAATLTTGNA